MRICCHSFLFANVMLCQTFFCLGHVTSQHPTATSTTPSTYHSHSSPTPTIKYHHHKHGYWKTNTICTASTMYPTLSSMTIRSTPLPYTTLYCSTKVVWSHTTTKHARPVHISKHQKPTTRKHHHTSTTVITPKAITTTSTPKLRPTTMAQPNINAFSNNQLHTPTTATFGDLPSTTNRYLSSSSSTTTKTSTSTPGSTVIAASDSQRSSTPAGSDSNDNNIATQLVRNNGSAYTNFGSGIGIGVGCVVVFGLAGLLLYYQRWRRRRRRRQFNVTNHGLSLLGSSTPYNDRSQQQEKTTRWRPQSFIDVMASVLDKLPRSSSTLYQANNFNIAGVAIGSGHGAVELRRHSLDEDSSSSPQPPFVRIPPHQY